MAITIAVRIAIATAISIAIAIAIAIAITIVIDVTIAVDIASNNTSRRRFDGTVFNGKQYNVWFPLRTRLRILTSKD
jgi:hypothetical protein